jgi:hypothetical protein
MPSTVLAATDLSVRINHDLLVLVTAGGVLFIVGIVGLLLTRKSR